MKGSDTFGRSHVKKKKRRCGRQDTHVKSKWEDHMPKNCTLFWQKTHFQVKMSKAWWTETLLEGHMLHGVGARSTPPSQNAPKTCLRTIFRGSRVEKLARMSKSKCTQQTTIGNSNRGFQTTFWKIICRKKNHVAGKTFRSQMSKHQGSNHLWRITSRKKLLLWQETYWQVKMSKVWVFQTLLKDHMPKNYTAL